MLLAWIVLAILFAIIAAIGVSGAVGGTEQESPEGWLRPNRHLKKENK